MNTNIIRLASEKIDYFISCLEIWKNENGLRDYPWRKIKDPFKILVTEVLLRRTKSDAVALIWDEFFSKYTSFKDLRKKDKNKLMKDIESLGLVKIRTESLIEISKSIQNKEIPVKENELVALLGIGIYTARMFLLMYKNERHLIYDANFRRVYSRFFGITINANLRSDKNIEGISEEIIPHEDYKDFVLTILDFSALVCKPVKPDCIECICKSSCYYFSKTSDSFELTRNSS